MNPPASRRSALAAAGSLAAAVTTPRLVAAQAPASTVPAAPTNGSASVPPLIAQLGGQWPSEEVQRQSLEEFLFQRAVQAYLLTLPALNMIGLRDGSEATFGRGYHVLPVWKDRMGARTWVPTPNCDVIYSMSYLDLKEAGPLVVYAPPNVIGMFTDFMQHTLTDVGAAGPDQGRGGLYLLLPPDHEGPVPGGYHAFRSNTYNVFLFFRTLLTQGADGPDTRQAVATAEATRVYPLGSIQRRRPRMEFPNATPVRVNMMYPTDFTYWEKLKRFIDYEPVGCLDPVTRGMLAGLGIVKGEPFQADARFRAVLTRAVETAPRMLQALRLHTGQDVPEAYIYEDRPYLNPWAGADADFMASSFLSLDARALYFQVAYSSAPAMVVDAIGMGSKYPGTFRDSTGATLDGGRSYRLRLPPGIPAELYWAVTAYNAVDGTMPETGQPFPSRNQFDRVTTGPDGSVELFFGPTRPAAAPERNWIETLPGRALLIAVRLYGTGAAYYDQSWKPDSVVRIG